MNTAIMHLERKELDTFCDLLPEPIIARPVLVAARWLGLTLVLEFDGQRVELIEDALPLRFCSIDAVIFELDGVPNLDKSNILIETKSYWQH